MTDQAPTQTSRPFTVPESREPKPRACCVSDHAGRCRSLLRLLALALAAGVSSAPGTEAATPAHASLAGLPLFFEANCGQAALPAQFVAHSRSGTVLLGPAEVVVLQPAAQPQPGRRDRAAQRSRDLQTEVRTLSFRFVGGNPQAAMTGLHPLSGKINYILGDNPASWQTEVPAFDRVRVAEVYPGVDLVYYGNQQKLEYDFIVAPGADAGAVCLRVTGADRLELDAQGDLVLSVGAAQLRQHKPILHQVIGGVRTEVTGGYRLKDPQTVVLEVGRYDPQWPLVIDPVLSYASYLGGSGNDTGWDVALDGAGNVYVAGETLSADLPTTTNAWQTNYAGGYPGAGGDAFVAKFDNTCSNLLYMTYLGGKGDDAVLAIAVDAGGYAYVTGATDSPDFPVSGFAIRTNLTGIPSPVFGLLPYDAFVAKLNPGGSALVYSTYVGGDTYDEGIAIAVDSAGCAYITGFTDSTNFPTTVNALQPNLAGATDAFVAKINSNGTAFVYSTYLGGTNLDQGDGIAVDALGRAWITGVTESTNFPVTNAIQPRPGGGQDAFVTVVASDGLSLIRSTYLGGVGDDAGYRIALDAAGNAYVVGTESSSWSVDGSFPITPGNLNPGGVFTSTNAGNNWSRSITGLLHPQVYSLAVDPVSANRIYAGTGHGVARSGDGGATWHAALAALPTADGLAPPIAIGRIFALAINPLSHSTLYAGTSQGIYQSLDAGTNWTLTSTGLVASYVVPYVQAIAVDLVTPSTLYAGTSLGVFSSTNAAANWDLSTGLYSYDVRALAIDPRTTNLYAATIYGVYRSTGQGGDWTPLNNGLTNTFCLSLAIDTNTTPSTLYVGTANALFKSINLGANWNPLSLTLGYTNGLQINVLAPDPVTPATLYAGTDQGTFKSSDGGMSWSPITNGLSVLPTYALAVSPANSALLYAGTIGFPSTNGSDAFLTKLDAANGSIHFSTILSGNDTNQGWAVAVDVAGNSYIVGVTTSTNFPTAATSGFLSATNSLSATNIGLNDVFVTVINADASAFLYSAYLGGTADDFGYGIAVDANGNAYVVGQTSSTDFPVVGALQPALAGGFDAFIAKIQPGTPSLVAALVGSNLQLKWPEFPTGYVLQTEATLSAGPGWGPVAQPQVLANGWYTVTLPATNRAAFFRLHHP
jgi:hypothetical protein